MARMIPPTIDPDVKSNAERRIYGWFSQLDWKNCVVLHSLGIAHHLNNVFGEIDFVIVSNEGILCIEVKGGRVGRTDGLWTFTNRYNQIQKKHTGPFEQAQGNMQSLRTHIKSRIKRFDDSILKCQYACSVMTPDCEIDASGPDVIKEILFDLKLKETDLGYFLDESYKYWRNKCRERHNFEGGKLSNTEIERVVELLRGDFNFVPPLSTILNRTDEALLSLTAEQYLIMQGFEGNPRMLISGAAGTGKTLLAMEQCRRAEAEGRKVLFLCFNSLIASYVRDSLGSSIDVYTFHAFLFKVCGIHIDKTDTEFFEITLPESFLRIVEDGEWTNDNKYDLVVIDEGQDLMKTNYYMCLNELMTGNIANGHWSIYFDPNQNIFGTLQEFQATWDELKQNATSYTLTFNCRNTKQIGDGNKLITNISQARIMKTSGNDIEYIKYSTLQEERKKLINSIRNLRSQGVKLSDIVILSPYIDSNPKCCLSTGDLPGDIGQLTVNNKDDYQSEGRLKFFTIQAFKGLESKVILMIDVDEFKEKSRRLLNYVGISRARTLLYIFYDNEVEQQRQNMLISGMLVCK